MKKRNRLCIYYTTHHQIFIHQIQYNHRKLNLQQTNSILTINKLLGAKQKRFLLPTEISLGGQSHCNTSPAQSLNACQLSSMLISIVSLLSAIQLSIQCVPRPDPSGLSWETGEMDGFFMDVYKKLWKRNWPYISQKKTFLK